MEWFIQIISRVILTIYFLLLLKTAVGNMKVRFGSNKLYVAYMKYLNEKTRHLYGDMGRYNKIIFRSLAIQVFFILWITVIIHNFWFSIISLVASIFIFIEVFMLNWKYADFKQFKLKDWLHLYLQRLIAISGDFYYIIALIAIICIH